tara:strand:- start:610 stop:1029 length:420 start_codon:yes stop_codon:yes gene_type:complete
MDKIKEYTNEDVTVVWKPGLCIHSEKCWRGLPEVFKPKEKPWIQPNGTKSTSVIEQVGKCPSGALSIKSDSKGSSALAEEGIKIEALKNGPLMVHSDCVITKSDGTTEVRQTRVTFCRCGHSANKPYCDGAHKKEGFMG